jgi:hypothetical protein
MRMLWTRLRAARLWFAATAVALVALALAVGASASHPEVSLPGSNFEIDTDANLKAVDRLGRRQRNAQGGPRVRRG